MSTSEKPFICFHFLSGACQYGDRCYKDHETPVNKLTPAQHRAYLRFTGAAAPTAPAPAKKPKKSTPPSTDSKPLSTQPNPPLTKSNPPAPTPAPESEPAGIAADDIASCFDFLLGTCKRASSCKFYHRDLTSFTDEELEAFQRRLTKNVPQICFAALGVNGCGNDCGRVHKAIDSLTPAERTKWERFSQRN